MEPLLEISPSIKIISKGQFIRDELIGNSLPWLYTDPDSRNAFLALLSKRGRVTDYELVLQNKDGSTVPCAISASMLFDANGNPVKITGILRDITECVLAEKKLKKNEERLSQINEISKEVVWEVDANGLYTFVSPFSTAVWGYTPEQLIGKMHFYDLHPEEDREQFKKGAFKAFAAKAQFKNFLNPIVTPEGKNIWVETNGIPLLDDQDNLFGYLGSDIDITERKLTEENLEKSEDRFRQVVAQSQGVVWEVDPNGLFTFVSSVSSSVYGYSPEELIGKLHFYDLHPVDQREQFKEAAFEVFRRKENFKNLVSHIYKPDRQEAYISTNGIPMLDGKGNLTGYCGIDTDITERKKAEQEIGSLNNNLETRIIERTTQLAQTNENLRKEIESRFQVQAELDVEKQRLADIIEGTNVGTWEWNIQTGETIYNKRWAEILGYTLDEISPGSIETWLKFVHPDDIIGSNELFEKHFKGESDYFSFEARTKHKNGNWVLGLTRGKILDWDQDGKPLKMSGTFQDISERKLAEHELEQISTRLALAAKAGGVGVWDYDLVNNILVWDDQMFALYGIEKKDFSGAYDAWQSGLHPEDKERGDVEIQMAIRGEKEFDTAFRVVWPDGSVRNIRALAIVQRDSSGNPLNLIGTNWDITAQKQAETLLNQTRQNYETFFNTIDNFLFVLNEQGNIIHTNETVTRRLGYKAEELLGESVLMVHPVERREEAGRIVGEMLAGTAEFCPVPLVTKSGNAISVETKVKSGFWDGKTAIFGVTKDVSEIKLSEEKFSKAFHTNATLMAISSLDGTFIDVNDTFLKTLGYSREEVIGNTSLGLELFEDPELRKSITEKLKQNIPVREVELTVRIKSGEIRSGLFSAVTIHIGKDLCLLTVMVDITERKRSEKALKESEARFSSFMDYLPAVVFLKDHQGRTLFVNRYMEDAFGASAWIGKTMIEVFPTDLGEKLTTDDINSMQLGYQKLEESMVQLDGKLHYYETQKFTIDRSGQEPWLGGISLDITERKHAEEEVIKSREEAEKANRAKSEFLSRMSHELRTPMNSILGFAQLMDMGELNPKQKKSVRHIVNGGKHLLNLINEVLDISGIESGQVSFSFIPVQLSSIIRETIDTVHPSASALSVKLELMDSGQNRLFVKADPHRLRQVLLNLINHAVKYNRKGGSVMIKTELQQATAPAISVVKISVSDTGSGINPEFIQKLFMPFERIGAEQTGIEGTGLGLMVVKKLMNAMGGSVGVESVPGEGSTFWIELPYIANQETEDVQTEHSSVSLAMITEKTGTILYIEDNASNTELVVQILLNHR